MGFPYVYLSPGEYNVAVRLDMENIGLTGVSIVDLSSAGISSAFRIIILKLCFCFIIFFYFLN